jgi:hypothetical protein
MVPIFVFLNKFVQIWKTQKNWCLKTTFVQKKRLQIFSPSQNDQIYLKLTIHFLDCSEKEQIMQK